MIKQAINRLLERQHYWRTVGFDELSELYTSVFLRSLALNVVGIFVPIYLYRLGYGLTDICLMYACWFALRPLWAYLSARYIARFGPKHAMALGVIAHIAFLSLLLSIERMQWPLFIIAGIGSFAVCSYVMAYEVDFSKVKHQAHGGKELGYVHIFTKIGTIVGPLLGGVLATLTSPEYTIAVAMFAMLGSLVPIFMSAEPTRIRQRLEYAHFPFRRHKHDFISALFLSVDGGASLIVWPLFLGVVVFTGSDAFAAVGILTALGTVVALIAIKMIGRLIDDHQGGLLLRAGVVLNSAVHFCRAFVATPLQALPVSIVNEPVTSMFQMPYAKGMYDAADSEPGYRVAYLSVMQSMQAIGLFGFWLTMTVLSLLLNDEMTLRAGFILGAFTTLGILYQRFPALRIK